MKKLSQLGLILSGILLVAGQLSTGLAFAFSGNGNGTAQSPYLIDSCSQLEEINTNLSAYYKLEQSINCSGLSSSPGWAPLGANSTTPFTGTLNGDGNSITGLTYSGGNDAGLFGYISGATISSLSLFSPTISGTSYVGGLVGDAESSSTISNVNVYNATISGTNSYIGGIVGNLDNSTLLHSSFQNGSVTATNNSITTNAVGGAIGIGQVATVSTTWSSGSVINNQNNNSSGTGGFIGSAVGATYSDSYSTASVEGQNTVGGFVGVGGSASFNNDYSSGQVTSDGGQYFGGFVGEIVAAGIDDSFSVGEVTANGGASVYGGFIGETDGVPTISSDTKWDEYSSGQSSCLGADNSVGGSTLDCVGENAGNTNPSYFLDNDTNTPMSNWDFSSVWLLSSATPELISTPAGAGTVHAKPSATSVQVTWNDQTLDNGSLVTSYSIKWRQLNSNQPYTQVNNISIGNPSEFTITGLSPNTEYSIFIQPVNTIGVGNWQGFVIFTSANSTSDSTISAPDTGYGSPTKSVMTNAAPMYLLLGAIVPIGFGLSILYRNRQSAINGTQ